MKLHCSFKMSFPSQDGAGFLWWGGGRVVKEAGSEKSCMARCLATGFRGRLHIILYIVYQKKIEKIYNLLLNSEA